MGKRKGPLSGIRILDVTQLYPGPLATMMLADMGADVVRLDTVPVAGSASLTATLSDSSGNTLTGRTVTWTSANTAIATVSTTGAVTGVAIGSTSITATSEGKSATVPVTVTPNSALTFTASGRGVGAAATPRLYATGFVTTRDESNGVRVVGIDPLSEASAPYREGIREGEYLAPDDREGVLLGWTLAKQLAFPREIRSACR